MSSFRFWVWAYWVILFSTFLHCRRRTTGNLVWIFIVTLERIIKMKLQIMDPFYKVAALCLYDLISYTHFSSAMHTFICVVSHRIHYAVQLRCYLRLLIMRFKEQTWRILRVIKLILQWLWTLMKLAGLLAGRLPRWQHRKISVIRVTLCRCTFTFRYVNPIYKCQSEWADAVPCHKHCWKLRQFINNYNYNCYDDDGDAQAHSLQFGTSLKPHGMSNKYREKSWVRQEDNIKSGHDAVDGCLCSFSA